MKARDIRKEIHRILDSHDAALEAIRGATSGMQQAHTAMRTVFEHHDAALVSAIEANRAALNLLNRLMDEGVEGES